MMKKKLILFLLVVAVLSCKRERGGGGEKTRVEGTWQLVSATLVEKGDTTTTLYGAGQRMIKIINQNHFAFLNHDTKRGGDSTKNFSAGGGRYTLKGDQYTEFLDYCSDREWEGHEFQFTVKVQGDTLIQTGVEKLPDIGVERQNTEKYVRVDEIAK